MAVNHHFRPCIVSQ